MELSKNVQGIFDEVIKLTPVELNELVKGLEEEFGVSAAAMAVAAPAAGGDAGGDDAGGSDAGNVELTDAGQQKIAVIKVVKEVLGLGLKEAKEMVEKAPVMIKEGCKGEEAEGIKTKLEEAGATVTLK